MLSNAVINMHALEMFHKYIKGRPPEPNRLFFFNIVQTAFDLPPLVLNIYVGDFFADYIAK